MNIKNEEAKRNRNRERIYLFVAEYILICGCLCSDGKFDKRMENEALDFVLSQESWQNEEHGNTSGASCSLFLRFAHGDMFLFGVLHFILFIFFSSSAECYTAKTASRAEHKTPNDINISQTLLHR